MNWLPYDVLQALTRHWYFCSPQQSRSKVYTYDETAMHKFDDATVLVPDTNWLPTFPLMALIGQMDLKANNFGFRPPINQ